MKLKQHWNNISEWMPLWFTLHYFAVSHSARSWGRSTEEFPSTFRC